MEVRAKKALGQHFLTDQAIARRIVDTLSSADRDVLEIGPGMGVLTQYLLQRDDIDRNEKIHLLDEASDRIATTARQARVGVWSSSQRRVARYRQSMRRKRASLVKGLCGYFSMNLAKLDSAV